MLLALAAGLVLGALFAVPALLIESTAKGGSSTAVIVAAQLAQELSFLALPFAIAVRQGASSIREALHRLGVRRVHPSALIWMAAAYGGYFLLAVAYVLAVGRPHQQDIAKELGAVPIQVLLIVVAAPISEEVCFRGMLFGGLRKRLPRFAAALVAGAIFGGLHALTGLGAVPLLIAFGVILSLLYEKTGSIVPGILLHMLNNSLALLGQ